MNQTQAPEDAIASSTQTARRTSERCANLLSPQEAQRRFPLNSNAQTNVERTRAELGAIFRGEDESRVVIVCGPCSIDDLNAALVYGEKLRGLQERVSDKALVVMRAYLEKPRSVVGWKGLLYAPRPNEDGQENLGNGISVARRLLGRLNEMGVACATEFLNPILALYLDDAIAYGSIGSRTAESQIHRELVSRLPMPVGIKNGMDGDPRSAINGVVAAQRPHSLFGMNAAGAPCLIETEGNPLAHVILRGGSNGPNYEPSHIAAALTSLNGATPLRRPVLVDCSHGNSEKDFRRQARVARDIAQQVSTGQNGIAGIMLESYLVEGRQEATPGGAIRFGQSITDACMGWAETERLVLEFAETI